MFKLAVLCVILCHGTRDISGAPQVSTDTAIPSVHSPKINGSDQPVVFDGNPNFSEAQQTLAGSSLGEYGVRAAVDDIGKELNSDYLFTPGIGAHKLHRRAVPWNYARQICIQEGGHLAVIRSESEEKIVLQMLSDDLATEAWLGFHDQFEEGDWVSVLDEPLGETGWARWSKKFTPNPDNYNGKQNCARIVKDGGGMDDIDCSTSIPFVCKISI